MERKVTIGEVSHGTLRSEDLVDSFAWELSHNTPDGRTRFAKLLTECEEWENETEDTDGHDETGSELVNALIDALNEYAPGFTYFGANEGDGSSFGFWPDIEAVSELPHVSDPSEVEDHLGGPCVFVNDHGNVTVYGANGKVLWDCV